MSAEAVGAGSVHPVLAALTLLDEVLDGAFGESTWSMSGAELGHAVVASTSIVGRVEAFRAGLLRESVSREIPDSRGEQGARTVNLLKARCRVSARRATADVRNARLTCPDTGTFRRAGCGVGRGRGLA